MYLGWFDDTRKKSPNEKIEEAVERYTAKFGKMPTLCLVNAVDATTYEGLEVRVAPFVSPNHFLVGEEEKSDSDVLAA
jgi:hypothetical protein